MKAPTDQTRNSFGYLALGLTFFMLGITMKGMLAFTGVGAAFLYLYYKQRKQSTKEKDQ